MADAKSKKTYYLGTGRRKTAVARVRMCEGSGHVTINGRAVAPYDDAALVGWGVHVERSGSHG